MKSGSLKSSKAGSQRGYRVLVNTMKFISDTRDIEDVADGETAGPVPDMGYELRTINCRFETSTILRAKQLRRGFARGQAGLR